MFGALHNLLKTENVKLQQLNETTPRNERKFQKKKKTDKSWQLKTRFLCGKPENNIRRAHCSGCVLTLCSPRASRKDNQAKENGSRKELKCDLEHGIFDRMSLFSYVNR